MNEQLDVEDSLSALHSSDLEVFLRSCPADEVTSLAQSMADAYGDRFMLGTLHVPRSVSIRGLRGYGLIADIKDDLAQLSSYKIGPALKYAQSVEWIAGRHGIKDVQKEKTYELERQILCKYEIKLIMGGGFSSFKDKGAADILRKVFWVAAPFGVVDYGLSANWGLTTFITLKISIMRLINKARLFRSIMEG